MAAEDVPPPDFFKLLDQHFTTKFPKADPLLREHLLSLERIVWHACAFGLSFKGPKIQLAAPLVKMLGDYVGRGALLKDPEKAEAVRVFPTPTTLKQLQEFLGYVWVCSLCWKRDPICIIRRFGVQ